MFKAKVQANYSPRHGDWYHWQCSMCPFSDSYEKKKQIRGVVWDHLRDVHNVDSTMIKVKFLPEERV